VALGRRKDACRLAVRLAQMAIGRARGEARRPYGFPCMRLRNAAKRIRSSREVLAQRGECATLRRLLTRYVEQYAADQRLRLVVPVRFACFAGRVVNERIGERGGVLRKRRFPPGSSRATGLNDAECTPVTPNGSITWTGPKRLRARRAIRALSPLGSMQTTDLFAVRRFGITVPTPLPVPRRRDRQQVRGGHHSAVAFRFLGARADQKAGCVPRHGGRSHDRSRKRAVP